MGLVKSPIYEKEREEKEMLRELNIRKLNDVVFIEVKAKRYEDNYKELCLMIDYIIKNSYAKLEGFDIEEKFEACFSSNKLDEIIEKAREYAEDEKVMEWCLEEKNGNIKYEDY
mgnify:CR=1 FL=1